jgi:hypothetical protein
MWNAVSHQLQRTRQSLAGAASGACSAYSLAVDETQDGCHPVSVGSSDLYQSGSADCLTTSFTPLGGIAILPRGHQFSLLSRLLPGFEHRRRVQGFSLPLAHGSVATLHCRCRLARGPQFGFPQHVSGKSSNAAKSHVVNVPSRVTFHTPEHDSGKVVNVQQVVGEIRNV